VASWKNQLNPARDPGKLDPESMRPPIDRVGSVVSKLSSDEGSGELDEDDSDGEALACKRCGGKDFRARRVAGKGQKLVCKACGATVD
jgi:WD repeat-containing protein 44